MLAKNTHNKYRKNNKSNKNQDLEKEEAKKGPEMSANIRGTQRGYSSKPLNTALLNLF